MILALSMMTCKNEAVEMPVLSGRGTHGIWGALFVFLLYAASAAAEHISFEGEVGEGKFHFVKEISDNLFFIITKPKWAEAGGWEMTVSDSEFPPEDRMNFIRLETPAPLHGHHLTEFIPGEYGIHTYELIYDRKFCFLADKHAYKKARDALDVLYWPSAYYKKGDDKEAIDYASGILGGLKTGSGKLTILSAQIAGKNYKEYAQRNSLGLPITFLKFKIDLDIPAKPDAKGCF